MATFFKKTCSVQDSTNAANNRFYQVEKQTVDAAARSTHLPRRIRVTSWHIVAVLLLTLCFVTTYFFLERQALWPKEHLRERSNLFMRLPVIVNKADLGFGHLFRINMTPTYCPSSLPLRLWRQQLSPSLCIYQRSRELGLTMADHNVRLAQYLALHRASLHLIALRCRSKVPLHKDWPNSPRPSVEDIHNWVGQDYNAGIRLDNLVAIDWDVLAPARDWFCKHRRHVTTISITRRGVHMLFARGDQTVSSCRFEHGDIKTGNAAQIVAPGSCVQGHVYRFAPGADALAGLTTFNPIWFSHARSFRGTARQIPCGADRTLRAWHYVNAIPGVAEGNRDNKCFAVACKLVQGFGLGVAEAWPILLAYNARCAPPLTNMRQLKRKLLEAKRRANT